MDPFGSDFSSWPPESSLLKRKTISREFRKQYEQYGEIERGSSCARTDHRFGEKNIFMGDKMKSDINHSNRWKTDRSDIEETVFPEKKRHKSESVQVRQCTEEINNNEVRKRHRTTSNASSVISSDEPVLSRVIYEKNVIFECSRTIEQHDHKSDKIEHNHGQGHVRDKKKSNVPGDVVNSTEDEHIQLVKNSSKKSSDESKIRVINDPLKGNEKEKSSKKKTKECILSNLEESRPSKLETSLMSPKMRDKENMKVSRLSALEASLMSPKMGDKEKTKESRLSKLEASLMSLEMVDKEKTKESRISKLEASLMSPKMGDKEKTKESRLSKLEASLMSPKMANKKKTKESCLSKLDVSLMSPKSGDKGKTKESRLSKLEASLMSPKIGDKEKTKESRLFKLEASLMSPKMANKKKTKESCLSKLEVSLTSPKIGDKEKMKESRLSKLEASLMSLKMGDKEKTKETCLSKLEASLMPSKMRDKEKTKYENKKSMHSEKHEHTSCSKSSKSGKHCAVINKLRNTDQVFSSMFSGLSKQLGRIPKKNKESLSSLQHNSPSGNAEKQIQVAEKTCKVNNACKFSESRSHKSDRKENNSKNKHDKEPRKSKHHKEKSKSKSDDVHSVIVSEREDDIDILDNIGNGFDIQGMVRDTLSGRDGDNLKSGKESSFESIFIREQDIIIPGLGDIEELEALQNKQRVVQIASRKPVKRAVRVMDSDLKISLLVEEDKKNTVGVKLNLNDLVKLTLFGDLVTEPMMAECQSLYQCSLTIHDYNPPSWTKSVVKEMVKGKNKRMYTVKIVNLSENRSDLITHETKSNQEKKSRDGFDDVTNKLNNIVQKMKSNDWCYPQTPTNVIKPATGKPLVSPIALSASGDLSSSDHEEMSKINRGVDTVTEDNLITESDNLTAVATSNLAVVADCIIKSVHPLDVGDEQKFHIDKGIFNEESKANIEASKKKVVDATVEVELETLDQKSDVRMVMDQKSDMHIVRDSSRMDTRDSKQNTPNNALSRHASKEQETRAKSRQLSGSAKSSVEANRDQMERSSSKEQQRSDSKDRSRRSGSKEQSRRSQSRDRSRQGGSKEQSRQSQSKDRSRQSGSKEQSRRSQSRDRSRQCGYKEQSRQSQSKDRSRRSGSKEQSRRSQSRDRSRQCGYKEQSRQSQSKDRSRRSGSKEQSRRSQSRDRSRQGGSKEQSRRSQSKDRSRRSGSKEQSQSRDKSKQIESRDQKQKSDGCRELLTESIEKRLEKLASTTTYSEPDKSADRTQKRRERQFHPYKKDLRPSTRHIPHWSFDLAYSDLNELLQNLTENSFKKQKKRPADVGSRNRIGRKSYGNRRRFCGYGFRRSTVRRTPPREISYSSDEEEMVRPDEIPNLKERARQADVLEEKFMGNSKDEREFSTEIMIYGKNANKDHKNGSERTPLSTLVIPGGPKTSTFSGHELKDANEDSGELAFHESGRHVENADKQSCQSIKVERKDTFANRVVQQAMARLKSTFGQGSGSSKVAGSNGVVASSNKNKKKDMKEEPKQKSQAERLLVTFEISDALNDTTEAKANGNDNASQSLEEVEQKQILSSESDVCLDWTDEDAALDKNETVVFEDSSDGITDSEHSKSYIVLDMLDDSKSSHSDNPDSDHSDNPKSDYSDNPRSNHSDNPNSSTIYIPHNSLANEKDLHERGRHMQNADKQSCHLIKVERKDTFANRVVQQAMARLKSTFDQGIESSTVDGNNGGVDSTNKNKKKDMKEESKQNNQTERLLVTSEISNELNDTTGATANGNDDASKSLEEIKQKKILSSESEVCLDWTHEDAALDNNETVVFEDSSDGITDSEHSKSYIVPDVLDDSKSNHSDNPESDHVENPKSDHLDTDNPKSDYSDNPRSNHSDNPNSSTTDIPRGANSLANEKDLQKSSAHAVDSVCESVDLNDSALPIVDEFVGTPEYYVSDLENILADYYTIHAISDHDNSPTKSTECTHNIKSCSIVLHPLKFKTSSTVSIKNDQVTSFSLKQNDIQVHSDMQGSCNRNEQIISDIEAQCELQNDSGIDTKSDLNTPVSENSIQNQETTNENVQLQRTEMDCSHNDGNVESSHNIASECFLIDEAGDKLVSSTSENLANHAIKSDDGKSQIEMIFRSSQVHASSEKSPQHSSTSYNSLTDSEIDSTYFGSNRFIFVDDTVITGETAEDITNTKDEMNVFDLKRKTIFVKQYDMYRNSYSEESPLQLSSDSDDVPDLAQCADEKNLLCEYPAVSSELDCESGVIQKVASSQSTNTDELHSAICSNITSNMCKALDGLDDVKTENNLEKVKAELKAVDKSLEQEDEKSKPEVRNVFDILNSNLDETHINRDRVHDTIGLVVNENSLGAENIPLEIHGVIIDDTAEFEAIVSMEINQNHASVCEFEETNQSLNVKYIVEHGNVESDKNAETESNVAQIVGKCETVNSFSQDESIIGQVSFRKITDDINQEQAFENESPMNKIKTEIDACHRIIIEQHKKFGLEREYAHKPINQSQASDTVSSSSASGAILEDRDARSLQNNGSDTETASECAEEVEEIVDTIQTLSEKLNDCHNVCIDKDKNYSSGSNVPQLCQAVELNQCAQTCENDAESTCSTWAYPLSDSENECSQKSAVYHSQLEDEAVYHVKDTIDVEMDENVYTRQTLQADDMCNMANNNNYGTQMSKEVKSQKNTDKSTCIPEEVVSTEQMRLNAQHNDSENNRYQSMTRNPTIYSPDITLPFSSFQRPSVPGNPYAHNMWSPNPWYHGSGVLPQTVSMNYDIGGTHMPLLPPGNNIQPSMSSFLWNPRPICSPHMGYHTRSRLYSPMLMNYVLNGGRPTAAMETSPTAYSAVGIVPWIISSDNMSPYIQERNPDTYFVTDHTVAQTAYKKSHSKKENATKNKGTIVSFPVLDIPVCDIPLPTSTPPPRKINPETLKELCKMQLDDLRMSSLSESQTNPETLNKLQTCNEITECSKEYTCGIKGFNVELEDTEQVRNENSNCCPSNAEPLLRTNSHILWNSVGNTITRLQLEKVKKERHTKTEDCKFQILEEEMKRDKSYENVKIENELKSFYNQLNITDSMSKAGEMEKESVTSQMQLDEYKETVNESINILPTTMTTSSELVFNRVLLEENLTAEEELEVTGHAFDASGEMNCYSKSRSADNVYEADLQTGKDIPECNKEYTCGNKCFNDELENSEQMRYEKSNCCPSTAGPLLTTNSDQLECITNGGIKEKMDTTCLCDDNESTKHSESKDDFEVDIRNDKIEPNSWSDELNNDAQMKITNITTAGEVCFIQKMIEQKQWTGMNTLNTVVHSRHSEPKDKLESKKEMDYDINEMECSTLSAEKTNEHDGIATEDLDKSENDANLSFLSQASELIGSRQTEKNYLDMTHTALSMLCSSYSIDEDSDGDTFTKLSTSYGVDEETDRYELTALAMLSTSYGGDEETDGDENVLAMHCTSYGVAEENDKDQRCAFTILGSYEDSDNYSEAETDTKYVGLDQIKSHLKQSNKLHANIDVSDPSIEELLKCKWTDEVDKETCTLENLNSCRVVCDNIKPSAKFATHCMVSKIDKCKTEATKNGKSRRNTMHRNRNSIKVKATRQANQFRSDYGKFLRTSVIDSMLSSETEEEESKMVLTKQWIKQTAEPKTSVKGHTLNFTNKPDFLLANVDGVPASKRACRSRSSSVLSSQTSISQNSDMQYDSRCSSRTSRSKDEGKQHYYKWRSRIYRNHQSLSSSSSSPCQSGRSRRSIDKNWKEKGNYHKTRTGNGKNTIRKSNHSSCRSGSSTSRSPSSFVIQRDCNGRATSTSSRGRPKTLGHRRHGSYSSSSDSHGRYNGSQRERQSRWSKFQKKKFGLGNLRNKLCSERSYSGETSTDSRSSCGSASRDGMGYNRYRSATGRDSSRSSTDETESRRDKTGTTLSVLSNESCTESDLSTQFCDKKGDGFWKMKNRSSRCMALNKSTVNNNSPKLNTALKEQLELTRTKKRKHEPISKSCFLKSRKLSNIGDNSGLKFMEGQIQSVNVEPLNDNKKENSQLRNDTMKIMATAYEKATKINTVLLMPAALHNLQPGLEKFLLTLDQFSTSRCKWILVLLSTQVAELDDHQQKTIEKLQHSHCNLHLVPDVTNLDSYVITELRNPAVHEIFVITEAQDKDENVRSIIQYCCMKTFLDEHLTSI